MKTHIELLGLPLTIVESRQQVIDFLQTNNGLITYLNPQSFTIASQRKGYLESLQHFDYIVADGVGIQVAVKLLKGEKICSVSMDFSGIAEGYLSLAQELNWKVLLVGGTSEVISITPKRLRERFPKLNITHCFSGYGDDLEAAHDYIVYSKPDLVLVGLGMGLQEHFLVRTKEAGWNGRGLCVGGMFDKIAYPQKDYSDWSIKWNVRFLYRLSVEPQRLWRRYFIEYQPFIWKLTYSYIRQLKK